MTSDDFTAKSITGVGVNLYLGRRFRARSLFQEAKFREADKYIGDGKYYEPEDDAEQAGGGENTGGENTGGGNSGAGENQPSGGGNDSGGSGFDDSDQ